ncbi:MAG: phospholipase [Geobacteraceae bacterium GWC2_53_11]|nr:MAG: phospholipase [Geobacteraceae bacterium GWC2_53_11]
MLVLILVSLPITERVACADQVSLPDALPETPVLRLSNPPDSALEQRIKHEMLAKESIFSILPHKPNYLLPVSYNISPNNAAYANEKLDNLEVKFQLSIKTPIWENIIGENSALYVAYSQLAFWQAYNSGSSSPFREINFEPEAYYAFKTGHELLGVTSEVVTLGFVHQSNGRTKPESRSWNRIVGNLLFSSGDTYVAVKTWFRIPEEDNDDDNPHMEKYYGYGELLILQKLRDNTVTLMLRNNLRTSGNKGAVQVDWSFFLHNKLKGYVQYFNGYGESLVDYNHANNRIGVGVMLTDRL